MCIKINLWQNWPKDYPGLPCNRRGAFSPVLASPAPVALTTPLCEPKLTSLSKADTPSRLLPPSVRYGHGPRRGKPPRDLIWMLAAIFVTIVWLSMIVLGINTLIGQ